MSSRTLVQRETNGFSPDARFAKALAGLGSDAAPPEAVIDPLEVAFARGMAEGEANARREYEARLSELEERYSGLGQRFIDLANVEGDRLRLRLRETVLALCEAAIAPLALDTDMLAKRVEAAAGMLMRAQDERRIRLNPEDLQKIRVIVSPDLALEADPSLPRGALRIETQDGGIEDGMDTWRQAIREAIGQC